MTNGNYAVTNSKNLLGDALRELLPLLDSWHSLIKENCARGMEMLYFSKNKIMIATLK